MVGILEQIQEYQGDIKAIARKFNIDWTTAKKWKNRNSIEDQPMGNGLQFSYSTLQAALKPDNVHSFDIYFVRNTTPNTDEPNLPILGLMDQWKK